MEIERAKMEEGETKVIDEVLGSNLKVKQKILFIFKR